VIVRQRFVISFRYTRVHPKVPEIHLPNLNHLSKFFIPLHLLPRGPLLCCVLIGASPYLVPLPPGDDPIAVTVIIIIIRRIIQFNSILYFYVLSQQLQGQLQTQHSTEI
jgi:hypothetical protein